MITQFEQLCVGDLFVTPSWVHARKHKVEGGYVLLQKIDDQKYSRVMTVTINDISGRIKPDIKVSVQRIKVSQDD